MVKWQQVSIVGIVSLFFLLGGILNLSGVSYSTSGDVACTDCFSEIKVNSTYWQIKVEHAGDKPSVFKKQTRSRTLWVNLDKINELVTTDPTIKVDILVPTNRIALTEINHPEYGRLRFLKDGDTLIFRNTKSRPQPSRIILHGTKEATQTIKWNFDLKHWLMEDINIDPVWLPIALTYTELTKCDTVRNIEYDTCSRTELYYHNYTYINNITKIDESRQEIRYINSTYNCNPRQVSKQVNCKTIGITTNDFKLLCPIDHRCDIIGTEFCASYLPDADKNFPFTERGNRGWSGACIKIKDLTKEMEISTSNYKKKVMRVERN